jgi:hypothetical protein
MTDEIKRNFLGIPIIGTPQAGSTRVDQYSQEDFEAHVKALLDDEFFVDFGWRQCTPYFNDGDPCEFSAHGFWVRTVKDVKPPIGPFAFQESDDDEELDPDDFEFDSHPTLGELTYPDGYWTAGYGSTRKPGVYVGDDEHHYRVARDMTLAIEGGHFENVLLDLFGDHCQVKVSRTGITIDEYSHD